MNMRMSLIASCFAAALVAVPSAYARTDVALSLNVGPPAPIYEPVPPARVGYVWAPGYWDYDYHRHHYWRKGHWEREHHGQHWVAGGWHHHEGRWYLDRGHWAHG